MDMLQVKAWLDTTKISVDLLKSAASLLPKGSKRDAVENKILAVESSLAASNAKLARDLGMKLCNCTFPPQIMLWIEAKKADQCPRQECGRTIKRGVNISRAALSSSGTGGGSDDWMRR